MLLLIMSLTFSSPMIATDYYFSSKSGSDTNNGKSEQTPLKSLSKANELNMKPGDKLLLKRGDIFFDHIELSGIKGVKNSPIIISAYGEGSTLPIINSKGYLNGILLEDCSYIEVSNLEITANGGGIGNLDPKGSYMRCGIMISHKKEGHYSGITLKNLFIRDVFYEEPGFERSSAETLTPMGTQNYGWGIRVINSNPKAFVDDLKIVDSHIKNVGHTGIRLTGKKIPNSGDQKSIKNIEIKNNIVEYTGGPGMQASVVENIYFVNNTIDHSGSGDDSRKWARGSGLWVWGCFNALIEHNSFRNANGPGDSSGCHIDFNNKNVLIQYNLSENNAGGFIHIFGNNRNSTYRYNVSINDGHRDHIPGKTLGHGYMVDINGWVGRNKKENGPYNTYIYNNTIYVKDSLHPQVGIAKTNEGLLIANNIFYLESTPTYRDKPNFLPENGPIPNAVFKNNLFLKADNWPDASKVMVTDKAPIYGDPQFKNAGGTNIEDYIPQNKSLIKNKGIKIENIPGDPIGLWGGLEMKKDILGNKIEGLPDMGAIEID